MVQKITWLPTAEITFLNTLQYLEKDFSQKDALAFADRVQQKLVLIQSFPGIGQKSKKPHVYKTVIHKKIMLYYQYKPLKNELLLLAFWNTLQDAQGIKW